MCASGGAVHNPSPTWKIFLLLRFPKIINIKPYFSATISIIRILGGKRLFGSDVPTLSVSPDGGSTNDGGKVAEQPPTAPITPPTVSSPEETDQGDGDKKPPQVKDLPGIDITEQPEVQQQEQGEQPSNEGQGPAGPLT